MSDNDTQLTGVDVAEATIEPASTSRRSVLRAAGGLFGGTAAASAASGQAAAQDDGLNVRTTDVEILDDQQGEIRTTGRVSGMSNYDCERCEVGAHVQPFGDDQWYGGLQTVKHTHRDSFRVGVTLAGLRPGKYRCRLCACPITRDHVFTANVIVIVVTEKRKHEKDKKKKKKHRKKYKKAYKKRCPCAYHHPDQYHLMICGGGGRDVKRYGFKVSSSDIERVGYSNAPHVISDRYVTLDTEDYVDATVVTGAVAGGGDSYVCGGYLEDIRADPGASVYLNGAEIDVRH